MNDVDKEKNTNNIHHRVMNVHSKDKTDVNSESHFSGILRMTKKGIMPFLLSYVGL